MIDAPCEVVPAAIVIASVSEAIQSRDGLCVGLLPLSAHCINHTETAILRSCLQC
jgi:hypothetical protein